MDDLLAQLRFQDGLIPAVIVDCEGGDVLTLCYLDEEALGETLRTGVVHVFRRSAGRVMKKGQTSGHTQHVRELRIDCEGQSLLLVVEQRVAACHVGYRTCYFRRYDARTGGIDVVGEKVFDPGDVYGKDSDQ